MQEVISTMSVGRQRGVRTGKMPASRTGVFGVLFSESNILYATEVAPVRSGGAGARRRHEALRACQAKVSAARHTNRCRW